MGHRLYSYPTQIIPYPYYFSPQLHASRAEKELREEMAQAHILVVGDRMAHHFTRFSTALSEALSLKLAQPLKVKVMAAPEEGLHRTLARLKAMEKIPRIVIYMGGSEEFFEQKFVPAEERRIKENFRRYQDSRLRTLLHFHPDFSRLIYLPYQRLELTQFPLKQNKEFTGANFQRVAEMNFELYQIELTEMIRLAQEKDLHLLMVTTPLNLEVRPKLVCENAVSEEILALQKKILALIQKRDFKSSQSELEHLAPQSPGNAMTHFLLGYTAKNLGNLERAKKELELAAAYDCLPWRGGPVYNAIMMKKGLDHEVPVIDFHQLVYRDWDKNILFESELFAQDLYYQKLVTELALKLAPILGLGQ